MILSDRTHIITTGPIEELHTFAKFLGLKREWFQDHPRHPHYDVISERLKMKLDVFVEHGHAIYIRPRDLVKVCQTKIRAGGPLETTIDCAPDWGLP